MLRALENLIAAGDDALKHISQQGSVSRLLLTNENE